MTARKPKPKPRKASGPSLEQRVEAMEAFQSAAGDALTEHMLHLVELAADRHKIERRLDALEARKDLRDKSHDEPVSNAGEAVGMNLPLSSPDEIDRFFDLFRNEVVRPPRWQFWRRG